LQIWVHPALQQRAFDPRLDVGRRHDPDEEPVPDHEAGNPLVLSVIGLPVVLEADERQGLAVPLGVGDVDREDRLRIVLDPLPLPSRSAAAAVG
jgi:hypothetical protein